MRAARADAGMTQRAFAAQLGVSLSWLANVEAGIRKPTGLALDGLRARLAELGYDL